MVLNAKAGIRFRGESSGFSLKGIPENPVRLTLIDTRELQLPFCESVLFSALCFFYADSLTASYHFPLAPTALQGASAAASCLADRASRSHLIILPMRAIRTDI